MFSTRPNTTDVVLTPNGVAEMAKRILDRGPRLEDAGVLYLAAKHGGTYDGRLEPWLLIWEELPRSPLEPESPAATAILEAALALADAHGLLATVQRTEPDLERHLEGVRQAMRDQGHREFDRGDLQQRASRAAREELDDRRNQVQQTIPLLEGRLKAALKAARKAAR